MIDRHYTRNERKELEQRRAALERRREREAGIARARVTQAVVLVGVKYGTQPVIHPVVPKFREVRALGQHDGVCDMAQEAWRRIGKEYGSKHKASEYLLRELRKIGCEREYRDAKHKLGRPRRNCK